MPLAFNTAGPCKPELHYMLPPEQRIPEVRGLVDGANYFVVHAPRQVGKTTALLSLSHALTNEGKYAAVLLSMEVGAPFSKDPGKAEEAVLSAWKWAAEASLPEELRPPTWPEAAEGHRIGAALAAWTHASRRPLVAFLDEIDALEDDTLISVLRQLRDGYSHRPNGFPHSLALIGLRDVRDYKVASGGTGRLTTSSPFNIKAESLTVRGFTRSEVVELYSQHTKATGQLFANDAVDCAFELTQGQPWLVNALARQCVEKVVRDRQQAITCADIHRAKEILVQRQDTHLDLWQSDCESHGCDTSSNPYWQAPRCSTSRTTTCVSSRI